jgi:hypothetical protein
MIRRVAFAAVLAVALSATGARAADCNGAALTCDAGFANGNTGTYTDAADFAAKCCVNSCSTATAQSVTCPANTLLDTKAPAWTAAQTECCVSEVKCTNTAFDAETFCPYGYKTAVVDTATLDDKTSDDPTVELCCDSDATVVDDFPTCKGGIGGDTAVQAQDASDTNWAVHDGNGFTRTVGVYSGMCFSLTINNDCSSGSEAMKAKCCAKKPMSYLQFKLPKTWLTPGDRKTALANLAKCKVSYGSDTVNARALKRVTTAAWKTSGDVQLVNIPVSFKRGQRQATVCVYALSDAPGTLDCSWSNLCGIDTADVEASPSKGCEIRMVGKAPTSSACCSPTLSIDAFDSSENRLAAGGNGSIIELVGAGL